MLDSWIYALTSVMVVSLISLIGLATISLSEKKLRRALFFLVSLAVGGLFGDAFIHLLPEAFENAQATRLTSLSVLGGLFVFLILEKVLRWRHEHMPAQRIQINPTGWLNLFADGLHNLIDGLLIGAAWLASEPIGIATTLAVILHEVPQEIGDFGVLLQAGFSRRKALFFNFLSAMIAIAGTIIALVIGSRAERFSTLMIPFTAGGFIYLAGCDLLPELNRESALSRSLLQLVAMMAGAGLMLSLTWLE